MEPRMVVGTGGWSSAAREPRRTFHYRRVLARDRQPEPTAHSDLTGDRPHGRQTEATAKSDLVGAGETKPIAKADTATVRG